MIFTYAITKENCLIKDVKMEDLRSNKFKFYWVDFEEPTNEETKLLSEFFHFHPLANQPHCLFDAKYRQSGLQLVLEFRVSPQGQLS